MFQRLCGSEGLENVMFVSTFWEKIDTPLGEKREKELTTREECWEFFIKRGARVSRHSNNPESARVIVADLAFGVSEVEKEPKESNPVTQKETFNGDTSLNQFAPGQELERGNREKLEALRQRINESEQMMRDRVEAIDRRGMNLDCLSD